METITLEYNGFIITTDKHLLKPQDVHHWLSSVSYWSKDVPYKVVKTAFDHSYCIGAVKDGKQVAYARLVTDYSVFAYLADVYVEEQYRGLGISKKMMEVLMSLEWVKSLRRIMLATLDAHTLYTQFGFALPAYPERLLEITRPAIYGDLNNPCK